MGNIARDEAERPVRRVRRVPLMECCGYKLDVLDLMWISWIGILRLNIEN